MSASDNTVQITKEEAYNRIPEKVREYIEKSISLEYNHPDTIRALCAVSYGAGLLDGVIDAGLKCKSLGQDASKRIDQ